MPDISREEGWYAIDLHVHTPASKDYKGRKNEDEYKDIIKKAVGKESKDDKGKTIP